MRKRYRIVRRDDGVAAREASLWYVELTQLTQTQFGNLVQVTAVNPSGGSDWFYYWFVDGQCVGRTAGPEFSFRLDDDDAVELSCRASTSADYELAAIAPDAFPARRTLEWTAADAGDDDVSLYRVQQATGASTPGSGDWETLADVPRRGQWRYLYLSERLSDLTWYWWRVLPVDVSGNAGTALVIGPEYVVRRPEKQDFSMTFDDATQRVTIA